MLGIPGAPHVIHLDFDETLVAPKPTLALQDTDGEVKDGETKDDQVDPGENTEATGEKALESGEKGVPGVKPSAKQVLGIL